MKPSLREMSKPRTDDGAVSERYMGAACMANPMPSPYANRPATRPSSEGARPCEVAPRKYNAAASWSSRLLPSLSPRETAAAADAVSAPASDALTTSPVWNGSRLYQSVPLVTGLVRFARAPEVTPMSQPKSKPPIAGNTNAVPVARQSTGLLFLETAVVAGNSCACSGSVSSNDGRPSSFVLIRGETPCRSDARVSETHPL